MLNLVTGPTIVDEMHVTVQKEIADRMIAEPGSSNYGALSILLRATGDVKTIRILKPTVFWPQPQVERGPSRCQGGDGTTAALRRRTLGVHLLQLLLRRVPDGAGGGLGVHDPPGQDTDAQGPRERLEPQTGRCRPDLRDQGLYRVLPGYLSFGVLEHEEQLPPDLW